jgi:hypothetical protein
VVLYARNAWDWVTSCYKHNAFYTDAVEDFRTFMRREASRCDFAERREVWSEYFGPRNVKVRLFDKIARKPGILRAFLGVIAPLDTDLVSGAPDDLRVNVGIDDASVRAVLLLNRLARLARLAPDDYRLTSWKDRVRRTGRIGRAVRLVDRRVPGSYWRAGDKKWLSARAGEWNDRFFPRYAPAEDRPFLEF